MSYILCSTPILWLSLYTINRRRYDILTRGRVSIYVVNSTKISVMLRDKRDFPYEKRLQYVVFICAWLYCRRFRASDRWCWNNPENDHVASGCYKHCATIPPSLQEINRSLIGFNDTPSQHKLYTYSYNSVKNLVQQLRCPLSIFIAIVPFRDIAGRLVNFIIEIACFYKVNENIIKS